jgi:hypothetical protein
MEQGAVWPEWVYEVQRRAPNSMVEVQALGETFEAFQGRVYRRLRGLKERGVGVSAVVYAAASPVSSQQRHVRRFLCRTLLSVLGERAEIVLSGEGWSTWGLDARAREDLLDLAGELSVQLTAAEAEAQRGVTVSVRFGEPAIDPHSLHAAAVAEERGRVVRRATARGVYGAAPTFLSDEDDAQREIA